MQELRTFEISEQVGLIPRPGQRSCFANGNFMLTAQDTVFQPVKGYGGRCKGGTEQLHRRDVVVQDSRQILRHFNDFNPSPRNLRPFQLFHFVPLCSAKKNSSPLSIEMESIPVDAHIVLGSLFLIRRLMKLASLHSFVGTLILFSVVSQTAAQDLIIEARVAIANNDSQYAEAAGNWQNSSVHTTAPGTTGSIGSRFNTTVGSSIILTPNLAEGGSYFLDLAFPVPVPASQSADIVVRIDLVGATLTDLSTHATLNGDVLETTIFRRATDSGTWRRVGKLVLDEAVTAPTITFTHISGALNAQTGRFYSDAFRFVNASDPCLNGLPVLNTVNGPLAAGQTFVNVPGVAANATKVTVYADGVQIGQKSTGIVGGDTVEVVTTSPLVAGQVISVTQHDAASIESCRPNTGPVVGSGPNPPVRIAYSLRMDAALTGPIGAPGASSSGWLWMLGATGPTSGFGTAPASGAVLQPGACWQTVTFQHGTDPGYTWIGVAAGEPTFAILDSIAFSMEFPYDSGPYAIYVDNIKNGSTLIEDFENIGTNNVVEYLLNEPDYSGTTAGFLLSQAPGAITPNVSMVTNAVADTGTNSTLVSWQFKDTAAASWVRIPLQGTGRKNPQVDLSQPISMRFLVLPVGQTAPALQVANIGNLNVTPGGNITLQAPIIKGSGALTYQWRKEGQDIANATTATYAINNATTEAAGNYSVVVSDGTCSTESFGALTVNEQPVEPTLTFARAGNNLKLNWIDAQAVLQTATTLTGPNNWTDVTTTGTTHEVPMTQAMQFFRLRR
jgi:hypothetical protein